MACILTACKKNDMPEVSEIEIPLPSDEFVPPPFEPALDEPVGTLDSSDFSSITVNYTLVDAEPPLDVKEYTFDAPGGDGLVFSGSFQLAGENAYRVNCRGIENFEEIIDGNGDVHKVKSGYEMTGADIERLDLDTGEVTQYCTVTGEGIPEACWSISPLCECSGGGLYVTAFYSDMYFLNDAYALLKISADGSEVQNLGRSEFSPKVVGDGIYADIDGEWLVLDESRGEFTAPELPVESGNITYSDSVGFATFSRPGGKGGYSLSCDKYTLTTPLRAGSLISATDKRAVIFAGGASTVMCYDFATHELCTCDLSEINNLTGVYPCGDWLFLGVSPYCPYIFDPVTGAAFMLYYEDIPITLSSSGGRVGVSSETSLKVYTAKEELT